MNSYRGHSGGKRTFCALAAAFVMGSLAVCLVQSDTFVIVDDDDSRAAVTRNVSTVSEPKPSAQNGDWTQWGGTSYRNNTPSGEGICTDWDIGKFDRRTGEWISDGAENIKWVARVGSQTYGNPVVADGPRVCRNEQRSWLHCSLSGTRRPRLPGLLR